MNAELSIESDKTVYEIGDVARFTVTVEREHASSDPWMTPTIWLLQDGRPVAPDQYPDVHMNEGDETHRVGWFVAPIHRGRWGAFRAEAMVYEPERHEIGTTYVDFEVNPPEGR